MTRALRAGGYTGAPGKVVMQNRNPEQDLMRSLGVNMTGMGLGSISDRELCNTLASVGVGVGGAIGTATLGARPTHMNPGETVAQFQARQSSWDTTSQTMGGTVGSLQAATQLCNLIEAADPAVQTVQPGASVGMNAWQMEAARRQLLTLQSQQSAPMSTGAKVAIGAGVAVALGAAAYFFL